MANTCVTQTTIKVQKITIIPASSLIPFAGNPPPHLSRGNLCSDILPNRLVLPIPELHAKGIIQYILLYEASFSQHNVFQIQPRC